MERSKKKADALLLAFSAWMADRKVRPLRQRTRIQYQACIRKAMRIASEGGYAVVTADVRTLRYILGKLSPHPSTQAAYLKAFACFFEFMKAQGMRKDNPAEQLGRPRQPRSVPRPLSIDDCCAYLDAASVLGAQQYALACLALYMGLRRDEIRLLQWTCFFEAEGHTWCDLDGKGGKKARIPVHPNVKQALYMLRMDHNSPVWLFPSPQPQKWGDPASVAWIYKLHRQVLEKAGIQRCTPHQLRHSFATHLRRTGVDIAVVQKGLRHSSLTSTQIYTAVLDDELAEAIERLDFRGREDDPA